MIPLFDDQLVFVDGLRRAFKTHNSVMGCAATGFGKTVTSAYIAEASIARSKRVIFSVHRDNLLNQTSGTFSEYRIPHSFIAADMPYNRDAMLHVASIDTLRRRLDRIEVPDLFVIDEAHLAMAKGWQTVTDYFRSRGAKVLGNSASPQRLDGKPLSTLFDTMVEGPSVRWLMDNGRLSDYEYYAPDVPDMGAIRKHLGDFDERSSAEVMDRPKLIGSVVANYKRLALGKRAVCFCINVKHSLNTVAEFIANGVSAAHIDAKTPTGERKRILNDFADGKIKVLCNVELVTTGFDLSAQVGRDVPVECVILCRPTMSLALFVQMVGRALRRKPYPAIILDHAGNSLRHGFPDDEREWKLDGDESTPRGPREGPPPPVTCTGCFRQVRRPAPSHCPHCGKRLMAEAKPIIVGEGDLILQTDDIKAAVRDQRRREEWEARTLAELVALGQKRGYASPQKWAFAKWSNSRSRRG